MAPGRLFTRDTTICRQQGQGRGRGRGRGQGRGRADTAHHSTPAGTPSVPSAHLAILQGHNPGVLCGTDDVVIPRDALQRPWPKSFKAVPLGGCKRQARR